MPKHLWTWFLILVFIAWGSQHPPIKILSQHIPPFMLNALRFTLATLTLLPFVIRTRTAPPRRDLWKIAGLGIIGIALYGLLAVNGIQRSTAINSSVLLNTHPVIATLLAVWWMGERLSLAKGVGIALGFIGLLIVISGGANLSAMFAGRYVVGNVLIVLSALCLALYATLNKPYIARYGGLVTTFYALASGATVLVLMAGISGQWRVLPHITLRQWGLLGYVAVVTTALAWVIWFKAIQRIGIIHTGTFFFIIPVSGILFSALWLGETITPAVILGTALILTGIFIVQRSA